MSITYTCGINYQNTIYEYSSTYTSKSANTSDNYDSRLEESVVSRFKRNHPDSANHVNQQLRAGRAVRDKNGLDKKTVQSMTMEEYQAYFYALLDTIPYDSTRRNDTTLVSISDKGWEQMRKDPDYEAWILGYFVEDRSVHNPFFYWGDDAGNVVYERFGASIEEHHGQGFSKAVFKNDSSDNDNDDDVEDWWIKRHKKMKKLLKEQVERTMKKNAAQKIELQEEYSRQQYLHTQRQHIFLSPDSSESHAQPETPVGKHAASVAAAAYIDALDLLGAMGAPTITPTS